MEIDDKILDYKIKDYIASEEMNLSKYGFLDCTTGINSFIDTNEYKNIIKKYIIKNNYTDIYYADLNKTIIDYWKDTISLSSDNIAFGQGTMGDIRGICEVLVDKGTKVLGIAPGFPRTISEVELRKGIFEYFSLDRKNLFKFDVQKMLEKMNYKYDIIYIDNPNNPTGQIISIEDIEKIVVFAKKQKAIVIIDEAYGDYMEKQNSAVLLVAKYDNIIVCKSASKTFGLPDQRIGYIIAQKIFIKAYNIMALPFPFTDLSKEMFKYALENMKFVNKSLREVKIHKQKLLEEINKIKNVKCLFTNVETPILTIKIDNCKNLKSEFKKRNILVECCKEFENLNTDYVRIRVVREYKKILSVIKDIADKYNYKNEDI